MSAQFFSRVHSTLKIMIQLTFSENHVGRLLLELLYERHPDRRRADEDAPGVLQVRRRHHRVVGAEADQRGHQKETVGLQNRQEEMESGDRKKREPSTPP